MKSLRLLSTAYCLALGLTFLAAAPLERWHRRNPLPVADTIFTTAYGNGKWVALTRQSALVSTDGITWQQPQLLTDPAQSLKGIAFGAGRFVALDWENVLSSVDGLTWDKKKIDLPAGTYVNAVKFVGNQFFLLGGSGLIMTSPDALNWTVRESSTDPFTGPRYFDIALGNGTYVAIAEYGMMGTSPDGITWTVAEPVLGGSFQRVVFGNDIFLATAEIQVAQGQERNRIFASPNGIDWSETASIKHQGSPLVFGHNGFYLEAALTNNEDNLAIMHSADGIQWVQKAEVGRTYFTDIVHSAEGGYAAMGSTTWPDSIFSGAIFTSANGSDWVRRDSGVHVHLDDIVFGAEKFVAVGGLFSANANVVVSSDGKEWAQVNLAGVTSKLRRVAYGNGVFVALGRLESNGDAAPIFTSPDGLNWTRRETRTSLTNALAGLAFGEGRFVAVGSQNTIATSFDGVEWQSRSYSPSDTLISVSYGNGRWVAAGNNNGSREIVPDNIMVSIDGIGWARQSSGQPVDFRAVGFGNGRFVATPGGGVYTSIDGISWKQIKDVLTNGAPQKIVFGGGRFLCVSRPVSGNFAIVSSSVDGETWAHHNLELKQITWSGAYGRNTFVVLGDMGVIVQSDPVNPLGIKISGRSGQAGFELRVEDAPSSVRLQSSDDLNGSWTLREDLQKSGDGTFVDSSLARMRFYRAVAP